MNWFDSAKEHLAKWKAQETEAWGNFTPRAMKAIELANKEAQRLNHNFIGGEHLLLGLIKLGQGVATNVLINLGLNLENVRIEVETQIGTKQDQKLIGRIPFTPRMKRVLETARTEAKQLNHSHVGTEHLLLGLLHENEGVSAQIFQKFNVNKEKVLKQINNEHNPKFLPGDEGQAGQEK